VFDFDRLAEQRIVEAMERGEFEGLAGRGAPLRLDEDQSVPAEWRLAHRILKNAGFVPEEVALRQEIADARAALDAVEGEARRRAVVRLSLLETRLEARRGGGAGLGLASAYRERALARVAGRR